MLFLLHLFFFVPIPFDELSNIFERVVLVCELSTVEGVGFIYPAFRLEVGPLWVIHKPLIEYRPSCFICFIVDFIVDLISLDLHVRIALVYKFVRFKLFLE